MTAIEFINKMIGKPWVFRRASYDYADCYGLVILYYKDVLGIDLPCNGYMTLSETDAFYHDMRFLQKLDAIEENAITVMYYGENPVHVGVIIDGNVLHSREGAGVKYDDLLLLKRLYTKIEYYKYEKN